MVIESRKIEPLFEPAYCSSCSLQSEKNIIPKGNKNAKLFIVGEAPGYWEGELGLPFVGKSGKLLDQIIDFCGIDYNDCYFTNAVMCRPEGNRNPSASELKCCLNRLKLELETVDPDLVLILGAVCGRMLINDYTRMNDEIGKIKQTVTGHDSLMCYHPAAVLYPKGEDKFLTVTHIFHRARRLIYGEHSKHKYNGTKVHHIHDREELKKSFDFLEQNATEISYDWETFGVGYASAEGVYLGMAWEPGKSIAFHKSLMDSELREQFNKLMREKRTIAFNASFDSNINILEGLEPGLDEDPMLMHHGLDERPQKRNLESLGELYLEAPNYESEMLQKYNTTKNQFMHVVPEQEILEYVGIDADIGLRLKHCFQEELEKPKNDRVQKCYQNLVIPAASVFRDVMRYGMYVNQERLTNKIEEVFWNVNEYRNEIRDIVGDENFNPNSHKQVQEYLWDTLKLKEPNIYGRKSRSADQETREALMQMYPENKFVRALHDYKDAYTYYSRYLKSLGQHIEDDGRVRANFHLDRTETGRLSTTSPALHQMPKAYGIKSIFGAPEGSKLIQADYEQIEIRMAGHIAQDKKLAELVNSGVDFHTKMASEAFNTPVDEVTKDIRGAAKAVSFGLLYLMTEEKLADSTGLSQKDAKEFVKNYKKLMPSVMKWIEAIKQQVREKKYVESIFGRRRRFPFIHKGNIHGIEREAVNMPIQSSASDLTLWSTVKLHNIFKQYYREKVKIVLTVHDSIIIECPDEYVEEVCQLVKDVMESPPFKSNFEFETEIKVGQHWEEGEIWTPDIKERVAQ